jgi:hypothetical protein
MDLSRDDERSEQALSDTLATIRDAVELELMKGLQSGPAREITRRDWNDLKQRVLDRSQP